MDGMPELAPTAPGAQCRQWLQDTPASAFVFMGVAVLEAVTVISYAGVAISALIEDTYLDYVAIARGLGAEWVSPNHLWIDRPMIEALHAAGVRVAVWTVNEDGDVDRAAAMGVDAIITDDPERTRARLATRR